MQTLAVPLQTETRPDEGLALTWIEVSGAIRYGLVIGVPGVSMPDLDVIMRGQTRQFAILGVPARFTGAVDIGTPAGATRQFGLVAYRNDGGIFPVSSLRIHPARSAPRDREYHAVVPPALVDAASAPQPAKKADPNDPWSALDAAASTTPSPSTSNAAFTTPWPSSEATPYTVAQPSPIAEPSRAPAPYDPWDVLSRPPVDESEPELETPPVAEPTPAYEDRYEAPAQSVPYEPAPRYEPPVEMPASEPEPPIEQPRLSTVQPETSFTPPVQQAWTPAADPEPYAAPPVEPTPFQAEPLETGQAALPTEPAPAAENVSAAPLTDQVAAGEMAQAEMNGWQPASVPTPSDAGEQSAALLVDEAGSASAFPTVDDSTERSATPAMGETGEPPSALVVDEAAMWSVPPPIETEPTQPGSAPQLETAEWTSNSGVTAEAPAGLEPTVEPAFAESAAPIAEAEPVPAGRPVTPAPREEAPPPPAPPLSANLGALLDEAELYLLPQWADSAAALSLVEEVEREAPGHPRTREVRTRIENMIAGSAHAVGEPDSAIEGYSAPTEPISLQEPPSITEGDTAATVASSAEESALTIEDDSTYSIDLPEKGAAVDHYEQVPAEKSEHETADAELAHARVEVRWPLRLAESAGDADALRVLGKETEAKAPDLAGQAYGAAFAIQPAPDLLRGWLLAFARAGLGEVIAGTARRAVRVLEERGKILPDPSVTGALESLEQIAGDGNAGTESAINHLCDALVGASQ